MIKIGPGLGSIYFSARKSGGPASLTITFGNGVIASSNFFLTINGVQYSFSLGQEFFSDVAIFYYEDGSDREYDPQYIANGFENYVQLTFSSSLTVSRINNNTITLTTKATSGASLSATCSLPIFPNAPLT
jgi:hypothetical protein